jgi:hypothetical protein
MCLPATSVSFEVNRVGVAMLRVGGKRSTTWAASVADVGKAGSSILEGSRRLDLSTKAELEVGDDRNPTHCAAFIEQDRRERLRDSMSGELRESY